jgi:hypothetical protein
MRLVLMVTGSASQTEQVGAVFSPTRPAVYPSIGWCSTRSRTGVWTGVGGGERQARSGLDEASRGVRDTKRKDETKKGW